jgi:hypothetical protein
MKPKAPLPSDKRPGESVSACKYASVSANGRSANGKICKLSEFSKLLAQEIAA